MKQLENESLITNHKSHSISAVAQLLRTTTQRGLVRSTDLDALIILSELNKSTIDYRTMLESSQRRLQQLAEDEQVARTSKKKEKTTRTN